MNNAEFEKLSHIIKSTTFSHTQSWMLLQEANNLYDTVCNAVVERISRDSWNHIFNQIDRKHNIRLILSYRTVCGSWNSTITSFMKISTMCSYMNIKRIIGIFPNLICLRVDRKDLIDLDVNLLGKLTKLIIYTDHFLNSKFPKFYPPTNLKSLSIRGNPENSIDNIQFEDLTNLTKLSLSQSNNISDKGLKILTNLKCLKLISTVKNVFDNDISGLTNLTSISLYNETITSAGLKNLTNLTNINSLSPYHFENECFGTYHSANYDHFAFNKYVGDWFKCKPHGFGKSYMNNNLIYEGNWLDGKYNGVGKYYTYGSLVWDGNWMNVLNYQRNVSKVERNVIHGKWLNNVLHGRARFTHVTGIIFECNFINGKKDGLGIGKFLYDNGSTYEGYWQNDKRHGVGTRIYPSGEIYKGGWNVGKKHGFGEWIYPDGTIYKGEWINDVKFK